MLEFLVKNWMHNWVFEDAQKTLLLLALLDHNVFDWGRMTYLDDKTFAGIVVGLSLTAPAELDLEPLEVSLVLDHFDEHLKHRHFLHTRIGHYHCDTALGVRATKAEHKSNRMWGSTLTIVMESASGSQTTWKKSLSWLCKSPGGKGRQYSTVTINSISRLVLTEQEEDVQKKQLIWSCYCEQHSITLHSIADFTLPAKCLNFSAYRGQFIETILS